LAHQLHELMPVDSQRAISDSAVGRRFLFQFGVEAGDHCCGIIAAAAATKIAAAVSIAAAAIAAAAKIAAVSIAAAAATIAIVEITSNRCGLLEWSEC
jgi:hypothetical protein